MILHDGSASSLPSTRQRNILTVTAFAFACLVLHLYTHTEGQASILRTRHSYQQINRPGEELAGFLDRTVGDNRDSLVWLTLADTFYSQTSTRHLHRSIEMNLKPYPTPGIIHNSRKHRLVILCLDEGCMESCREESWTCYDGFRFNRPDIMLEATWPKLAGIIQTLESGRDLMFVDSDVFLKGCAPSDLSKPIAGTALTCTTAIYAEIPLNICIHLDHMISKSKMKACQSLSHPLCLPSLVDSIRNIRRNTVNTGFMHISSNALTIAHFQGVLDLDLHEVSRDQANTNRLLGFRESLDTNTFHSLNGLEVAVIPPEAVYAYHLELAPERKEVSSMDAVAFHGTCLDNACVELLERPYLRVSLNILMQCVQVSGSSRLWILARCR